MWPFRHKSATQDPIVRTQEALKELNEALKELRKDPEQRHLRIFVTSYDPATRCPPTPLLGYWNGVSGGFTTVYDPRDS